MIFISLCFYLIENISGFYIFLMAIGLSNIVMEKDKKIWQDKSYIRNKKIK